MPTSKLKQPKSTSSLWFTELHEARKKKIKKVKEPKVYSDQWFAELHEAKQNPETLKAMWMGFDFALLMLDDMFAKSHPHKYNIADCIKGKVNRLPKSKIRKNPQV